MVPDQGVCFGPYRLVGPQGPLWRGTHVVSLPPKALAVLWTLVCHAGQVVTKAALLEAVWADTAVSDWALTTCIRAGEAYLPVLEALGRLGRGPGGEPLVAGLRQYAPTWLVQMPALLSVAELGALQQTVQDTTRVRMLRELAEGLEALTATRPTVLVLEDLHWSDPSTVEALALLARRRDRARLLVLGTYRPTELIVHEHPLKTMKQELAAHGQCVELPLGYLRPEDIEAYLAQRSGAPAAGTDLADFVYRRTEGHPLFMVQVVDYVGQQARAGAPLLPAAPTALEVGVPQGLRDLIEAQLGRMTEAERQVLAVASVVGAVFAAASVAAGVPTAPDAVDTVCEALAQRGQFIEDRGLVTWPDGTMSGQYGFRHALYQDVLYHSLSAGRRARLHLAIGMREEEGYGEQAREIAAELAMHFELGQDYVRAVRYWQQVGETALQRHAHQEAIHAFTIGLTLLQTTAATSVRDHQECALQLALGEVLEATKGSGSPEAETAYRRAFVLCQQLAASPQLWHILQGLTGFHLLRAELHTAHTLAERLLEVAQHLDDPGAFGIAHARLGYLAFWRGDLHTARTHQERSRVHHAPSQHPSRLSVDVKVRVAYLSWTLWCLGYPERALQTSQEALALARALARPSILVHALFMAARQSHLRAEVTAMQHQLVELEGLAQQYGFAYWAALAAMWRGCVLTEQGHHAEGLTQFQHGLAAYAATGARLGQAHQLIVLAEMYGKAGQPDQGLHTLAEAERCAQHSGEHCYTAERYRLTGELLLRSPAPALPIAPASPEACFFKAIEIARQQQVKSFELRTAMSLARLWHSQGKTAQAHHMLAEVYGWFTEGFDTKDLQEAKALLHALAQSETGGNCKRSEVGHGR